MLSSTDVTEPNVSSSCSLAYEVEAKLKEVLAAALIIHNTDMGLLSIWDPEKEGLRAKVSQGFSQEFLDKAQLIASGVGISGSVYQTGERIIVEDVEKEERLIIYRDLVKLGGFRAVHSTPLITRDGKVMGVLNVHFRKPHRPTEREIRLIDLFVAQAVDAIENASLREKLAQELREKERGQDASRRLAAIIESSDDAIISKGLNGIITSWNKGAEQIFGFTAQEIIGKPVLMLIPEGRHNEEPEILRKLQRGERIDHYHTVRQRKDGRMIDVSLTVSPIKDSNGKVIGASKIARDITALKETEAKFRQLADAMPQIVWAARPDGYLDYYNKRWYEYTGFPEGKGGDQSWEPILHPEDVQRCRKAWYESVHSGKDYKIEYRFKDRISCGYKWFLGRACPVKDKAGNVVRWFGTCTDIHEQKETQQELSRSNKELEEFAYVASHDLQEPLQMVNSFVELLSMRCEQKLSGKEKEYFDFIKQGAVQAKTLINELLEYSRIGRQEITRTIDLRDLMEEVKANLKIPIESSKAIIEYGSLPDIQAAHAEMLQLFQNLISNAIKYRSDETPHIEISCSQTNENGWLFAVKDNGIGIDPEYSERIFGMFQRLHSKSQYSGTGIGLAVCKKIVEHNGGRIWLRSQPGKGSTFYFTIQAI